MVETPLGEKMRTLAVGLPEHAVDLIEKAEAFETATAGYYGDPQTVAVKQFLGHYARARMLYCKLSGESLV